MKFSYIIWMLYLIVFPFYFFDEGNPQVADAFGTLLIIINLKSILLKLFNSTYTKFLFYFIVLTILINTIWMVILGDIILLRASIYYLYAFLLFMFVYIHLDDLKFVKLSVNTILASQLTLLVLWFIIPGQGVRTQLFFNNPNQLALWSLCAITICNSLSLIYSIKKPNLILLSILATFFILLSASRSAAVCALLFWMFFFIKSRKNFVSMFVLLVLLIFIASVSNLIQLDNFTTINYIIDRITGDAQPNDQGLAGRGYDRMIDFPEYLVIGSGEGLVERFNTNMELHSSFFNVWFSYGILGLLLFGRALLLIIINSYRELIVLFVILALFGHVHMTLRIPLFWIALGVLFFVKQHKSTVNDVKILKSTTYVRN